MTTDNRVTVAGAEDILGFIPHILGRWPKESLVALTLRGRILGATLRVDLPSETSDDLLQAYTRKITEYLDSDHEADGALLAVFSDDGWNDGTVVRRHRPVLEALELSLARSGLPLRDAWLIGADFWRSAFCNDEECCPSPGRPVDQIRDSRLNAEMVFRGSNVNTPPLQGPGEQPANDPEFMALEEAALEAMMKIWQDENAFEDVLDAWTIVLDTGVSEQVEADVAVFLRASLRVPAWRDAVVVLAAAGRGAARGGAQAFRFFQDKGERGEPLAVPPALRPSPASPGNAPRTPGMPRTSTAARGPKRSRTVDIDALRYGEVLLGAYPESPLWHRLTVLDHALSVLARHGGGEARAAALTLRGWIQWCRGSGSFAVEFLSQADFEHPGYRLAELLNEVVRRGTVCGWARKRASAWPKFGGAVA
ncbi:DUF4192 domain-containing protein [Arthrobacter sp. NyZ413]|uniref:DUF4192 domain-containing protein n=1 Tax=Arthrobacter sp. NyZ413 TaxID=3144669 RepID=UPI003BF921C0